MRRRNFLIGTSLSLAFAFAKRSFSFNSENHNAIVKPKILNPGDTVGIIAPGTAVSDPESIYKVKEVISFLNLEYKFGKNLLKGTGYKTRTDEERLDDLHSMFSDDIIKAIFCIRGGYGSMRLLDKIDYSLINKNPKIFLGYSDITALHLALNKFANLVTFHGPVLLSSFSNWTLQYFKKALFDINPISKVEIDSSINNIRQTHPIWAITPGKARGKLIGGNLSIISDLMGTPYEIDTKDKILFIEDVDEEPFRIDRMLTQLRLTGKLDKSAGIIFGECAGCSGDKLQPSRIWDYSLGEVLNNILGDLKIPVIYGYPIGHTADQLTIPLGVEAIIDADNLSFEIIESGVTS